MKGDITLKALEIIGGVALGTAEFIEAFLNAGYGASPRKMEYELGKIRNRRAKENNKVYLERQKKQRFYTLLYKLQNDGLIEKRGDAKNIKFRLTSKGSQYLAILKNNKKEKINLPSADYGSIDKTGGKFTIVVFDIPESERRKRNWLREALKNIGFQFIQKSVWFGKVKIPEEFLENLKNLDLVEFIEIFEITKAGSLRKID